MTYYRRQRMESFKKAMFADKLDRTLVDDEAKDDEAANEAWWLLPFGRKVMEPGKLAS